MQRYVLTDSLTFADLVDISNCLYDENNASLHLEVGELQRIQAVAALMVAARDGASGELIAFAWVKSHRDGAKIMNPFVVPEYRNQGLGPLLLRHILTHSALADASSITLAKQADETQLFPSLGLSWLKPASAHGVNHLNHLLMGFMPA